MCTSHPPAHPLLSLAHSHLHAPLLVCSLSLPIFHSIAVAVALPISFTSICHARALSLVQGATKDLAALSAKAAKAGADTVEDFAFSSEED